jgi:hypothetical protein
MVVIKLLRDNTEQVGGVRFDNTFFDITPTYNLEKKIKLVFIKNKKLWN